MKGRIINRVMLVAMALMAVACPLNPPAPPKVVTPKPLPSPKLSTLQAGFSVDVGAALQELERQVPTTLGIADFGADDDLTLDAGQNIYGKFQAERRPFAVSLGNNILEISTSIIYRFGLHTGGRQTPSPWFACGVNEYGNAANRWTTAPRFDITIRKDLSIDGGWQVGTPATLAITPQVKCTVGVIFSSRDATQDVQNRLDAEVRPRIADYDRALQNAIRLPDRAQTLWATLNGSLPIDRDFVLRLYPEQIGVSPLSLSGKTLATSLLLAFRPRVEATKANTAGVPTLPAPSSVQPGSYFSVSADAVAANASIAKAFKEALVGKRYYTDDRKYYLDIRDIDVYGTGAGQAALKVVFAGSARGTVYFLGTPVYDGGNRRLIIPDLDFDLQTRNLLLKAAAWLAKSRFREYLREALTFDFDPALNKATKDLERAINTTYGQVALRGQVNVTPVGFYVSPTETRLRVDFVGTLDATYQ